MVTAGRARRRRRVQSIPPTGGGKEELRAATLKPYLLHLRDERGEKALAALLATAGIPQVLVEDETGWISVEAARRALRAISEALGEQAVASRGPWMTHPQTLGRYVGLLRVSSTPIDAYRYLAAHAAETTRVGNYSLATEGTRSVEIVYEPRRDAEVEQEDRLLCLARASELAGITRLWGLADAEVEHASCLADGDDSCTYRVRWRSGSAWRTMAPIAGAAAMISGGAVALSGNFVAAGIAAGVSAALGGVIGALRDRIVEERGARVFEQNRISALERGLEMRGLGTQMPSDLTGVTLGGKYRIQRRIGSGGIGAVYAAEHVALGSSVAVKVLRGAAAGDASEIARLRREAQVQVSIEHENVVRTLDLDAMPDGSIYVVMELLRGASVADYLRLDGPLPPGFAIPIFMQVCRALSAAHSLGVVHRDLKPGNVFVCEDNSVKVLDFGMSKFAEAETLTQDGYTLGTPEYMSPEQCIGAAVEPRSDLYAFGVLMYESLTGEIPIQARNRRELLEMHQRAIPESMLKRRPDLPIPSDLDAVVLACLRKRAAERPKTARELERMLASVPPAGLVHEYPPGVGRRAPKRAPLSKPA